MTHEQLLISDITCLPPPCMTKARALEIYSEPFRRVIEYTKLCRVAGDITEFGTYHGFTARLFAELMKEYADPRKLWLYDSWQGFPSTTNIVDAECKEVKEGFWKEKDCTPVIGAETEARITTVLNHLIPGNLRTVPGFYDKSLQDENNLPSVISVLHIDCDLYESSILVLNKVKTLLSPGAVVLFDDFNNNVASNLSGERRAFKETIADLCEPWFTYGWSGYAFIHGTN